MPRIRNHRFPSALAAVLTLTLTSEQASATVVLETPLEQMVEGADAIVHGTVKRTGQRLVETGGQLEPHTVVVITVERWLKGGDGRSREIVIDEIGGRIGGEAVSVVGAPRYVKGQEVVVLLSRLPGARRHMRTQDLSRGLFLVKRDRSTGAALVEPQKNELVLAHWHEGQLRLRARADEPPVALSLFMDYLRELVARRPGRGGQP